MKTEIGSYEHPDQVGYRGWVKQGDRIAFIATEGELAVFKCNPETGAVTGNGTVV